MKKILTAIALLLMTQYICMAASEASSDPYNYPVKIVNKAYLPSDRLAEAIGVKGLLRYNANLLREAARLMPNNPEYWYFAAIIQAGYIGKNIPGTTPRRLLERSLSADPNYLPALYAYAITKPKYEQRMQELEHIATLDKDNAKVYYMMAMELYNNITTNRKIEVYSQTYNMSIAEWESVLDLIKQGNERPVYNLYSVNKLSTQDIKIKSLPPNSYDAYLAQMTDALFIGGEIEGALSCAFNASARQIARQAYWEAKRENKADNQEQALETIQIMKAFSRKYAASEPNRYISFMVAKAVNTIAGKDEIEILKQAKREDEILELQQEKQKWDNAIKKISTVVCKPEYLRDFEVDSISKEEANMKVILSELGM